MPGSRAKQRGGATLERLWDRSEDGPTAAGNSGATHRGGGLPTALRDRYDGSLSVTLNRDRPTVIANFVSTLDGVVAFDADGRSGGGEVSGFFEPDRFVMGMLRAMADVVLVGAGTVRAASTHEWTPRHVHRGSAELYADLAAADGCPKRTADHDRRDGERITRSEAPRTERARRARRRRHDTGRRGTPPGRRSGFERADRDRRSRRGHRRRPGSSSWQLRPGHA